MLAADRIELRIHVPAADSFSAMVTHASWATGELRVASTSGILRRRSGQPAASAECLRRAILFWCLCLFRHIVRAF